jgi:hypothetical protein
MRSGWAVGIALFVCSAAVISIGCRTNRSSNASTARAGQRETTFHALGTIVKVDEQAHDEQSYDLLPGPSVCFTIDSFAEIPSAERNVCESAERARQAAHGPRCRDTSIDPSAVKLKPGDRVDVYFTLQDSGQISIARVSARGVDL